MKLILDQFLGGLSESDRQGRQGSFAHCIDTDPTIKLGYLQAGFKPSTPTGGSVLGGRIKRAITDPVSAYIYAFEEARRLHRADSITGNLSTAGDYPHAVGTTSSGVAGEDLLPLMFKDTTYLLYSWKDSGGGDIGRVTLSGAIAFDDTYLSATINSTSSLTGKSTNGIPHPMLEWQENGMVYVGDGRALHQIANTTLNGTLSKNKLLLPLGWVITSLFNANDFIGITAVYLPGGSFMGRRSRAAVFFWDGTSPTWNRKVFVPDPEIRASYNLNGKFFIFCKDMKARGVIRQWDGSSFNKVKLVTNDQGTTKYPLSDFGQVEEWNNMLLFQSNGKLWAYGSPSPDYPEGLYQIASGTTAGHGGLVVSGSAIFASTFSGTTYYWEMFQSGAAVTFIWKSLYFEFPKEIVINQVKVEFLTLTSGADDDIKITTNYGDATTTLGSVSFSGDGAVESKIFRTALKCNNFRVEVDTDESASTAGIVYARFIIDWDWSPTDR